MDEIAVVEFVIGVISRFEKQQSAFKSISREQRDETFKILGNQGDGKIPPVGAYRPKHELIEKR